MTESTTDADVPLPRALLAVASATFVTAAALLTHAHLTDRELHARIDAARTRITQLETEIATLRAERAHLSRPDRLEPLARSQGLGPPTPQQLERAANAATGR
jgi:cell division protein FtsL